MKVPKHVLIINKKVNKQPNLTIFIVVKVSPDKENLAVDYTVVEAVAKDFRFSPTKLAEQLFNKEKKRLMDMYNIKEEDVKL